MLTLREMTLILIVVTIVITALIRPKYGLLGYLWYALARPDVLCYVEDERNIYSLIIFCATAIGSIRYLPNISNLFRTYIGWLFLALQIPFGLSVVFAVYPDLALPRYIFFVKTIVALTLIPILIETQEDLKQLYLALALSLGFVGLKFGLYGVVYGGVELASGYGPMLADNNFVALGLAAVMPLCWFGRMLTNNKLIQWALFGEFIFCIPGIVMTNSRGGILSLGLVMLTLAITAKKKSWLILFLVVGAAGSVYMVNDMFTQRMSTLSNVEEEASAASRLYHFNAASRMALDYPILGVGFGGYNYAMLSQQYDPRVTGKHVAHNSYVQVLVDSGVFALIIYVSALFGSIYSMYVSAKRMKILRPDLWPIPNGLSQSLMAFALGSTFYSANRMDLLYMLLLTASTWLVVERQLATLPAPAPAPANVPGPQMPYAIAQTGRPWQGLGKATAGHGGTSQ